VALENVARWRMAGGSLAERRDAHQRPGRDCTGARLFDHLIRPQQQDCVLRGPTRLQRASVLRGIGPPPRDYCLGGTRVDCQETNCKLWPRLAHTL
jgi:hypothetical protein